MERRYYTPAPNEQQAEYGSAQSPAAKTVVETCFRKAFVDRDQSVYGPRLQFFTDGQPPFFPTGKEREVLMEEASSVAQFYISDLVGPDGTVLPDKNDEFRNVLEIGSELVKIISDGRNELSLTQQSQALNILGASLYLARNPNATTEIAIGIGGSDSEFTSARFPAYSIPGARITEGIMHFYSERKRQKVAAEVADRLIAEEFGDQGTNPESKAAKRTKRKEIVEAVLDGHIDPMRVLEDEDVEDIQKKYAILKKPPVLKVFFAHEAARAINHTMDPEKIPQRTTENMAALQDYLARFHPEAASQLNMAVDKPWDAHTPYQKAVVRYLAHELRTSDDSVVQKTLALLRKLGQNHGGDMGAELAAEYAAVHPVVFGDRMDLPVSPFVVGETKDPDVRIVIGGKTEREFCAVREYLSKTASADRMIDFMNSLEGETDFDAVNIGSLLKRWKNITRSTRDRYDSNSASFARADLPVHTVQLITSVAATPTYYPTPFDIPSSASTEEVLAHADNLWALNGQLKAGDQSIDRAVLKHVAADYAVLRDDIKRSQALREGQEAHL